MHVANKSMLEICMTQEDILKDVGIPLFDHEYPIRVRYIFMYLHTHDEQQLL